MAAYGRITLNRGGRNSRFDCTRNLLIFVYDDLKFPSADKND